MITTEPTTAAEAVATIATMYRVSELGDTPDATGLAEALEGSAEALAAIDPESADYLADAAEALRASAECAGDDELSLRHAAEALLRIRLYYGQPV